MSDNVTANPGAGGPVFKTDEIGGVHTPITKVAFGVDGVITTVDDDHPLPVSTTFPATQTIEGEVSLDPATLAALETVQISNFPETQTVSGTVAVSNFPATQAVTGTFWQATQPISGTVTANTGLAQPLTDTQLRASAVPVTTGGLTDAQLRASDVKISLDGESVTVANFPATQPVSGTVTANTGLTQPVTDAQLRATPVPVSGTFYQATQPISAASLPLPTGAATAAKQDSIIAAIGTPMQAGGSIGNTTFGATQSGAWTVGVNNFPATQPVSGTVTANTGLAQPLTDAQLRASAVPVSGTFFQPTQPISAASLPLPAGAATDAVLAAIQTVSERIEILTDTILFIAQAQMEKMPRVTGNDQVAVSIETGSVGIAASQTLATLTTLGTINGVGSKYTSGDNLNLAGTAYLYNQITVS